MFRDGFARDCLLQRGVMCEPDSSIGAELVGTFGEPRVNMLELNLVPSRASRQLQGAADRYLANIDRGA